jgi:hypothetical protein
MRKAMIKCVFAYSLVSVLVGTTCASAQSLADVAREEEARRQAIGASGKVYTNDSLHPVPAPAAPAAETPSPAEPAAEPPADAQAAGEKTAAPAPKKDEAYWKQRLLSERDALERAKTFVDALQSRINALTADFIGRDDPAQRAVIAGERQKALTELDRVKREIQQHSKAITDVQEEGRKAGVPAGWLR